MRFKVTAAIYSQGRSQHFQKRNWTLLQSLDEFFKVFDPANEVSQIPLPKRKFEVGFTKAKDELFSHCYKDKAELLTRQIRLSCRFEKNMTCVFCIKDIVHYRDQFLLTEVVNLGYREIKHLYKNRFLLPASVTFLRAITMCSAFTPDYGYDNSTFILIGDVFCGNTKCSGKFARTKGRFKLWAEAIINVRNARLCVKCAMFLLKIK